LHTRAASAVRSQPCQPCVPMIAPLAPQGHARASRGLPRPGEWQRPAGFVRYRRRPTRPCNPSVRRSPGALVHGVEAGISPSDRRRPLLQA
jgi:hypothetical protein